MVVVDDDVRNCIRSLTGASELCRALLATREPPRADHDKGLRRNMLAMLCSEEEAQDVVLHDRLSEQL